MFDRPKLDQERLQWIEQQSADRQLAAKAQDTLSHAYQYNYGHQWNWLGLPIIQLPQDVMAVQEIIWANKPDVIVEAGIAWGGSVVFHASMLQLIGAGEVIAIDLNLMDHVAERIMSYPFSSRIHLYQGSSIDPNIVAKVKTHIKAHSKVMIILDSNHTHDHVLAELRAYGPLVSKGQYAVVGDTIIEDIPSHPDRPRPWGRGNNPKTAIDAFQREQEGFSVDPYLNGKLLMTFNPGGYLKRDA